SVSTETAQAPPCAYACTRLSMSDVCCDRSPAEGDASLHSAMMSKPSGESFKRGAVGAEHTRVHNACSDSLARACSSLARLDCAISVRSPDIELSCYRLSASKRGDLLQNFAARAGLDRVLRHAGGFGRRRRQV